MTATREELEIIGLAIGVLASVSAANLANRSEPLAKTLVNPYTLRELADKVEAYYPGLIEATRNAPPDPD